ncbi:uncharacterized protein LOC130692756 [Daphnia carinata]|uniref:uncharacterized protein LOC130692756 n=1 Tax=Daphnia carinata TaxID=120202 RepID=UPI00257CDB2C|nr:uncharacterized protein LOC130692756 [Daphnia carinata]
MKRKISCPSSVFIAVSSVILYASYKCDALVITQMIVPSHVQRGSDAVLRCLYDLDGDSLYSVKWYKGSHEFFGYVPKETPQFRVFPWSNFSVHYDEQEIGKVHLKAVTREAEGRYKCEVSTEGPHFNTDYREDNLTVYDIYSDGPLMVGHPTNDLKPGNQLRFTCSFRKSRPKPILSWFVDSQETVNKVESRYVMESTLLADKKSTNGSGLELWSAESELSIWPSARQLERKFLNVACRAIVLNETVYQRVASTNVTTTSALTVQLQQQVQRSRVSSTSSSSSMSPVNSSGQQHQVSASMASSQHSRDSYSFSAASKGQGGSSAARPILLLVELWLFVVGLSAALLS